MNLKRSDALAEWAQSDEVFSKSSAVTAMTRQMREMVKALRLARKIINRGSLADSDDIDRFMILYGEDE